jgi:hypothetical protein
VDWDKRLMHSCVLAGRDASERSCASGAELANLAELGLLTDPTKSHGCTWCGSFVVGLCCRA